LNKNFPSDSAFDLPFNTFSPENAYFFIEENNKDVRNYYVFSASGRMLRNEEQMINVSKLFEEKFPHLKLIEATGWASSTLLVVNTNTESGEQGPSFWFEVPSLAFIQLATRFD
jgi:hypothetical protein